MVSAQGIYDTGTLSISRIKNDKVTGANEILTSVETAEDEVAYLIHLVALELHKASKEIDSTVSPRGTGA